MVGVKNNRRTQFTVASIKAAYLELLQTQRASKITVTAICTAADINRGTFYRHFASPAALFTQIEEDLLHELTPLIIDHQKRDIKSWFTAVLEVLHLNRTAARIILEQHGWLESGEPDPLITQLFNRVHEMAIASYRQQHLAANPVLLDYYFTYFLEGAIGLIRQWLRDDNLSTDEVATALTELTQARIHPLPA